jgi:hypothetical protein
VKKRLQNYLLPLLLLSSFLIAGRNGYGQTVVITSANTAAVNGVAASPLISGQTAVLFGFTITATGSTAKVNEIVLNASQAFVGNAYLYRSTAGSVSFTGATLLQSLGTLGTYIDITGLSETLNNTSYTYFIVGDLSGIPSYVTLPSAIQFTFVSAIRNNPYNAYSGTPGSFTGTNYTINNPTYTITSANAAVNGITTGNITASQTGVVLFGFGISANVATTVSDFNINTSSTQSYLSNYLGNGKLYRSTSNTFSVGTATPVSGATIAFSTYQHAPGIAISGLSQSITTTPVYYFIVADFNQTSGVLPANLQLSFSTSQTNAIVQSVPNVANIAAPSNISGTTFTFQNPVYTFTSANTSGNGITSGTIISSQTGVVLFGFGLSSNVSTTVSGFNLNSSSTQSALNGYLGNGKLYRSTSSTFSIGTATQVTATVAFNGSHTPGVSISGLSESITSTTVYYFIVGDFNQTSGTLPANLTLSFSTSQTNAIVQSAPSSTSLAPTSTITGTTFTFSNPVITFTDANSSGNGITQGSLYPGQAGIVLYGFGITVQGTATYSGFNLYNTYNSGAAQSYFNNGKIYRSSSSTFSTGTATLISGATVSFGYDASSGIAISGLSESFSNNVSPVYYFIVGDFNSGYYGSLPATSQFSFSTTKTNSVVQSSPSASNIAVGSNINGTTFSLALSTATVTGANSTSTNGITTGSLYYGRTDIVLYGFSIQVSGSLNFATFNIKTSGSENSYFSNARIYRSTANVFPGGTPLYTSSSVSVSGGGYFVATVNETITNATYYYWLVADYTVVTGGATTFTCSFASGQGQPALIPNPYSTNYNTYNVTGNAFTIVTTENWTGANNSNIGTAGNYTLLNGGGGFSPTSTTVVRFTGTYTNAPSINSDATIGGITFTSASSPTISINSGKTLTLNTGLNLTSGASATISGGTLKLASGSSSSIASTAVLTLGASTIVNNLGTFTLMSDASGTGSIAAIPGTSSLTGSYVAQRYVTGGSSYNTTRGNYTYRNYRVMSSPVWNANNGSANYYNLNYIANSAIVTGATSSPTITTTAGNPTLYLYQDDHATGTSFTNGNFRGISALGTGTSVNVLSDATAYYLYPGTGFLFYFRGDKSTNVTAKTTSPYVAPESVIFSNTGTLNQGPITVKYWKTPASSLSNSTLSGNTSTNGLNLVGNPYPSSISWTAVYAASTGVKATIYEFDPVTGQYGSYVQGAGSGTSNASNVIASGQGFFVQASSSTNALNFTEACKITTQNTGSSLLLGLPVTNTEPARYLKLKLVKDSLNYDDIILGFRSTAKAAYDESEDATDLGGNGALESLSSLSQDGFNLSINYQPLVKKTPEIPLLVDAVSSGSYKLSLTELQNIPALYQIWLKDAYKNDSVEVRVNPDYAFTMDKGIAATFGSKRFKLVLKQVYNYRLLSFTGAKATGGIQLKWATQNEENGLTFTVERSIDGGKTYGPIGSLQSDGSGSYGFLDKNPATGIYKYRIKQDDYNNEISYSAVVDLTYYTASATAVNIYPIPTDGDISIAVNMANSTAAPAYTIRIVSTSGRLVREFTSARQVWQGSVRDLMPGVYLVIVLNNKTGKSIVGQSKFTKI